jgi:uncharacterized protein with PIN domain
MTVFDIGGCLGHGVSKTREEELSFKGDDSRLTDVEAAL